MKSCLKHCARKQLDGSRERERERERESVIERGREGGSEREIDR